ncbi:MAG: radical SAM protein [Deltaproteobacteria bacterium]|nr:radical SAM protein [Deltaproteobacteria bacterium]
MREPSYDFSVAHADGRFVLRDAGGLVPEMREYLQAYLRKISGYRPVGLFRGEPLLSLYQAPPGSRAGIRSLKMRLRRRFTGARIPATATLAVNRACQCACEHCSAYHYNHSRKPELSAAEWREAIAQTVGLGVTQLIFLGGEPLLRGDLGNLLASVPSDRACSIIFTNGEYMREGRAESLWERGLMGAFVSLDAARPEEHDRLRGRPGLFEKAIAGILHWRRSGAMVGISSYLSPQRLETGVFEEMMELGRDLGVNEVTFFDAIPSGVWLHREESLLRPSDRRQIRVLVEHYRKKAGYPGISAQSLLTSAEGGAFCFAANTQFYLGAGGEMCPCDFTPLSVGRFPEENLEALWLRMTTSPPYNCRAKACRMQDLEFRRQWIDTIPSSASLPWLLRRGEGTGGLD